MADNTINVRIKDRSDTEANWTSKNPVLLKGERAITDGTGKYKIGDGKNTWGALPYYEAMTSADRTKLNGIASGANKTTVDSSLSSSSTNPVQNKVVNSALAGKSNTNHTHDLSTMINTLSTGGSTPTDEDYFVSQYAGGGTTTTTYHRRPVKALLEYIKGKLAKVAISGSYDDLSNKPTIGNGTVTITQGGTSKGTFTLNQTGNTTIALTDNNSWRGIQNNLTSTSTTDSLSAAQGKVLNDKFASYVPTSRTVNGKALSANISLNASDVGASASGHTHNYVKDAGNNSSNTTFAYSKAGMNYGDYTWLAGWNGYELRAVNKNQFAASGHSHDYFSNHTQGEGFEFGFQYSKDINIAKTTAVTTYYVKIVEDGSFRFKNFYVKTYGNNTQYSFKMQAFANAYMQPNAIVNSQVYNEPEIKNVIFAKNPKNTYCHDIYLEIDSATSYDKKISVYADSSLVGTQTTTKPSNIELTVAIRYEDFIYSSKKAYFPKGIDGTASAVPWSGITGKPSTYTPSSHNHDDRYYTESEINSKLNGKANSSHTHNYAGSSSAGGSANSAVKLDTTTSGSATQPVYFSGGKPVACTYTLGKSVPSNAVFTDTNTWRPLGTGADQACAGNDSRLSNARPASDVYAWAKESTKPAYTWNEIGSKPSTFTPASHSHSSVNDSGNGASTTFAYSKAGMEYDEYTWLAAWNNNELRAIHKSQFARASHTHSKSQITDFPTSLPASDVKAWAKASTKPSYSWGEISGKPVTFSPSAHSHVVCQSAEPSGQNNGDLWFKEE